MIWWLKPYNKRWHLSGKHFQSGRIIYLIMIDGQKQKEADIRQTHKYNILEITIFHML